MTINRRVGDEVTRARVVRRPRDVGGRFLVVRKVAKEAEGLRIRQTPRADVARAEPSA